MGEIWFDEIGLTLLKLGIIELGVWSVLVCWSAEVPHKPGVRIYCNKSMEGEELRFASKPENDDHNHLTRFSEPANLLPMKESPPE